MLKSRLAGLKCEANDVGVRGGGWICLNVIMNLEGMPILEGAGQFHGAVTLWCSNIMVQ